jgi:antitoxin PrlF
MVRLAEFHDRAAVNDAGRLSVRNARASEFHDRQTARPHDFEQPSVANRLALCCERKILTVRRILETAMITSKLTAKAQTTIPQAVRTALRLKPGDELAYVIQDGRVILSRVQERVAEDPFGAFNEWDSDADRKAYGKL